MKRFSKILCYANPLEHSGSALQRALTMAKHHGAQLTLASIVPEIPVRAPELQESFVDIRRAELAELLAGQDSSAVDVDIQVLIGDLETVHITRYVIEQDYDLVIKPGDQPGFASSLLFGSNDQHLLRDCPVPVWIVKHQHKIERILAAIDVDPGQVENAELNVQITELATSLAKQYACELHVVHAWHMYGEETLRSARSHLPQFHVDEMLEQTREKHRLWLETFLGQSAVKYYPFAMHLEKGEPAEVIPRIIRDLDIDLTIMGTVARTGIPGFFIGNTAEKILAAIDCSVLAIKPRDFHSPVSD